MMLIREKVAQAKNLLREFQVDCWITFSRESQINGDPALDFLISGDITWHSAFIITASGKSVAIVGRYDRQTVEETGAYDRVIGFVEGIKEPLLDELKLIDPQKIAVNFSEGSEICDGLTHGMFLTLQRYLVEIGMGERLQSAEKIVSALRERKTATEIGHIREAIQITEAIFEQVGRYIRSGISEKDIASFMLDRMNEQKLEPAWGEATCPAVFSGPDTAGAHYSPTDRKVEAGHILNMDFGVKVSGYCSDMQRTFYITSESESVPPPEVQHGFNTIRTAVEAAKKTIVPGIRGHEIDAIARDIVVSRGYEEFPHGLGHQVGRYPHDGTALLGPKWEKYAEKPFQKLETDMVFTIEPRLPVAGRGTVTIEEMVLVTDNGCEWLSTPQTELIIIHL